jgi:hypothetical protein
MGLDDDGKKQQFYEKIGVGSGLHLKVWGWLVCISFFFFFR